MKKAQWRIRSQAACLAAAGMLVAPAFVQAESSFTTGDTNLSTDAHLDFRIVIPRILFLQVGTGTLQAGNSVINVVQFDVAAPSVGTGSGVTVSGGDTNNQGSVQARVISNSGTVTLSSLTTGPLRNATNDVISFSQITSTSNPLNSTTKLDVPQLADGVTQSVSLVPDNKLVNRDATWTFAFANSALVAPGTYGANANSGRVTYTATTP